MPEIRFRDLKQIPLFANLGKDDLRAVAELVKRADYPAGREICRQGQLGLTAYFVESGELRVTYVNPDGILSEVGRMGPGDHFGETSLLLGEPRDATVEVVQDATLLYLNKDEFDQLLHERPDLLDALEMRPDVAKKRRARRFKWQEADEIVIVHLHKHNILLYRHLAFPALVLLAGVMSLIYRIQSPQSVLSFFALLVGVLLILATVPFVLYLLMDHLNDDYVVTNKRVVHEERVPFVRESRTEAPLHTIQDIQESQQGLLAQVFGFSDLIIETAGERGHVIFRQIPNPGKTRDAIFDQIRRAQARVRAEERAAIRGAMGQHFGVPVEEPPTPAPTPPRKKRRFALHMPEAAWFDGIRRVINYVVPPMRHEQGDTVTWRKHWVALIRPIWLPTLVIVATTVLAIWILGVSDENMVPILTIYGIAMVFLLPWWIWRYDDWQNDIYQVTSTRIIDVERLPFFLREDRREASLDKIQNTSLEVPGVWAKLLNYGSVTIETAGTEPFTFAFVKDPRGVQAEITRRVAAFQRQKDRQEADQHRAELLDWFSVYDQMRDPSQADVAADRREP